MSDDTCYSCWVGTVLLGIYGLLYFRVLPNVFMRAWFATVMTALLALNYLATGVIDAFQNVGLSEYYTTRLCNVTCSVIFTLIVKLNPQIRIRFVEPKIVRTYQKSLDGMDGGMRKKEKLPTLADLPPGSMLCMNHTSFLDTFALISSTPLPVIVNCRVVYKASLEKTPLLGPCYRRVGHFPVFFRDESQPGSFSVDAEKQKTVRERMDTFVTKEKGSMCIFPEGRLNPDPKTLLPFRWGSIKMAMEWNAPIYFWVSWNGPKSWPLDAAFGGNAADVWMATGKLEIPKGVDSKDEKVIAALMQTQMQELVDCVRDQAERSTAQEKKVE